MPKSKRELTGKLKEAVRPFLAEGERPRVVADVLKGPRTILASLLTPIGFFLLERPRYVVLTGARLLVLIPPARERGEPRIEHDLRREDLRLDEERLGQIWTRLVLRDAAGLRIPLNFARVWSQEAEQIAEALRA